MYSKTTAKTALSIYWYYTSQCKSLNFGPSHHEKLKNSQVVDYIVYIILISQS